MSINETIATLDKFVYKSVAKRMLERTFPAQHNFITSTAKFKLARCTRRAGKSHSIAIMLLLAALKRSNSDNFYIALTRIQAKLILWDKLKRLCDKYNIDATFNESNLVVRMRNNSRINFYGADQENLQDRLLGIPFVLTAIDEAAKFTNLERLVEEILEPGTIDYRGSIALIGTPNPQMSGYFFEQDTSREEFEKYHWSLLDNKYLEDGEGYITALKRRKNWTDDTPIYQREYCGQWVYDNDHVVYKIKNANIIDKLPCSINSYVIGFDIGWNDPCAFTVVGWNDFDSSLYVIHSEKHQHLTVSNVAKKLQELDDKYKPIRIIADTGGLGKTITEELKQRYGLNVIPAEKKEKFTAIEAVNSDFYAEHIKIVKSNAELINQLKNLTLTEDNVENPDLPNDLCDSFLYAHRFSRHYFYKPKLERKTDEQRIIESLERECENVEVERDGY